MERIRSASRHVAGHELLITAMLAPFLMFSTLNRYLTALAAAGVLLVWVARRIGTGRITRWTPLNGFILALMLMIPVAMWASPLPDVSTDALCRILLGIALYFALINGVTDTRTWRWTLRVAAAGGMVIAFIGLISVDWLEGKISFLSPIYQFLPDNSASLGVLTSGNDNTPDAFHPNTVGATLAMLLPIVSALCLTAKHRVERVLFGLIGLVMLGVLVITQSRLGMASLAASVSIVSLALFPRMRKLTLAVMIAAAIGVLLIGPERVLGGLTKTFFGAGFGTWAVRIGIWESALRTLSDFPFTGIGLSTFYPAVTYLYAVNVSPTWAFGHAHDIYLQMGLDFGLAGLVSFIGMLAIALARGWPAGGEREPVHTLRIGVWTGLFVYVLFGLFDALPMWTKPGFIIWALLGWAMIGSRLAQAAPRTSLSATGADSDQESGA